MRTLRLPKGIRRTIDSINIVIRVVPKRKRNSSIDCGAAADRLRLLTATMAKKSYSGESMEKDLKIHMARALVHIVHVMCIWDFPICNRRKIFSRKSAKL